MGGKFSMVVATKDRPDDLQRLLESLRRQTAPPDEIVIVDASSHPVETVTSQFADLTIRYLRHWPPSASAQRNAGIQSCDPESTHIGFADDDTTFEPEAFEHMRDFWERTAPDVLGAAFNIRNYPARRKSLLKHSRFVEHLGLYSPQPGSVSRSGWHTVTGEIEATTFVNWIPSTAALFRRKALSPNAFDEAFDSYSYLEDLDLSYTISRKGRLAIVADAGFSHFASASGRVSARRFGRFEVRNRLHFVRKHKLSICRCYIGLGIRFALSVCDGIVHRNIQSLSRALGNLEELCLPRRESIG